MGAQIHGILERAEGLDEALKLLDRGIRSGKIERELKDDIERLLQSVFSNKLYTGLLQRGGAYSERTLILDADLKLRPDKLILNEDTAIVIDYKTGEVLPEHRQQVSNYLFALKETGYEKTEGYLYYLQSNTLERVQTDLFS